MNETKNKDNIAELPISVLLLMTLGAKPYFEKDFCIEKGSRNSSLTSLAGKLLYKKVPLDYVEDVVKFINGKFCKPVLDEREINQIIKSVGRYENIDASEKDRQGRIFPNIIAEYILRDLEIITNDAENSYLYNGKYWETLPELKTINIALEYDGKDSTNARRQEMFKYIQAKTFVNNIPWRNIPSYYIPLCNGVFDLKSKNLLSHNKEYYLESTLPHEYDENSECPTWIKFINETFQENDEIILAFQQFFGYCLMPHAKYKKALMCYGPPDTGKSVVGQVLTKLVGHENICSIKLEEMHDSRKVAPIKGKMVNLIPEVKEKAIIADGGFKLLVSTEDPIQIDPKFIKPETYIPCCKHVILTNTLPEIKDQTDAVYNRLLLIGFNNPVSEDKQDKELLQKLNKEINGIVKWAMDGALSLYEAGGHFVEPKESKELKQEYKDSQNPVIKWADERLQHQDGSVIEFKALYEDFCKWDNELSKDISSDLFSKFLAKAGYETDRKRMEGILFTVLKNFRFPSNSARINNDY